MRTSSVLLLSILLVAQPAASEAEKRMCSDVILEAGLPEPYAEEAERRADLGDESIYLRVFDVLFERLGSWLEREPEESSRIGVWLSRHYSKFEAEVTGLECESASDFLERDLFAWNEVTVGIVGRSPMFSNPDFEAKIGVARDVVVLRLREDAAGRFQELTRSNPGEHLYVEIGGMREEISIEGEETHGRIVLPKSAIQAGAIDSPILPFPMKVMECRPCSQGS